MALFILKLIVVLLSLYFIVDRLKKLFVHEARQSLIKVSAVIIVWLGIISFVIFPKDIAHLIEYIGLGKEPFIIVFIVIVVIFLIIFRLLSVIENLERDITQIVRAEALKEITKKKVSGK